MEHPASQGQGKKEKPKKEDKPLVRTRFGYEARDCVQSLQQVLSQTGSAATGKALHFSADIICSGGFEIWIRLIWSYVFQHAHLTSLRIFVYLQERTKELEDRLNCLDMEELYRNTGFQQRIAEVVLIVQTLPKQGKIHWPRVPEDTHTEEWIKSVPVPRESEAVRKVWMPQHDQPVLNLVGNQILAACEEVNIEKALFWLKWIFDEDKRIRLENSGYSLTTQRRSGGASIKMDKNEVGYYIAAILVEGYKDLARRGIIRMHEEFQSLLDLWKGKQKRLSSRQRQECLAIMILVISEVPRWKVPAAQPLVKDPTVMSRAVKESVRFFQEILTKPGVPAIVPRDITGATKRVKKGDGKVNPMEDQMRLMDEMVMAFIQR